MSVQCTIVNEKGDKTILLNKIGELEEDLKLAKQEISELKAESQELKTHNKRKFKGYETEYEELLIETNKVVQELNKVQNERDIAITKIDNMKKIDEEEEVDECIKDSFCQGDCEHVGCTVDKAQRLKNMKDLGGRRTSPVEEVIRTPKFRCPQCNFTTTNKNGLDNHVNTVHSTLPTCRICYVGFHHQAALKRHMQIYHNSENRPSVSQNRPKVTKGYCIFFVQPRGCKKGSSCDFLHEVGQQINTKVPKACRNGPGCNWKPGCRYVHLEDGEVFPVRVPRVEARSSEVARRVCGNSCFWPANECPRGGPTSCNLQQNLQPENPDNQGFGQTSLSQPPPGYTMAEYPCLQQPERPDVFRPWMNQGTSQ